MEKSATLNLRVNPEVKRQAEEVLDRLGLSMSTAIEVYLRQISMTGGIPFPLTLGAPERVNASHWSEERLHAEIQKGIDDVKAGRSRPADEFFEAFEKEHRR